MFAAVQAHPNDLVKTGPDAWHPSGLFAFTTGRGENTTLHLLQIGEEPKMLFSIVVSNTTHRPICLARDVILINAKGEAQKYDIKGSLSFKQRLPGFDGAARTSGKVGISCIFVAATVWNEQTSDWDFFLHVYDVSGQEIRTITRCRTVQPLNIALAGDELVVIGKEEITRLKLPKDVLKYTGIN